MRLSAKWIGIVLVLTGLLCLHVSYGLPTLNLNQEDCERCHGNNTVDLHHTLVGEYSCPDCHINGEWQWIDLTYCVTCHEGFDHHDGAQGDCSRCHDDKQQQHRKGRR